MNANATVLCCFIMFDALNAALKLHFYQEIIENLLFILESVNNHNPVNIWSYWIS